MPRMVTCDAFDSTQKESTTPKGVASTSHLPPRVASYRRQPRAIECTTPMGLPYHCPFITATQHRDGTRHGIYHHATIWSVTIPSRGVAPSMAGACAREGAEEVTPLGLVRSPISAPPRTRKVAPYLDSAHRSALICSMQADKRS